MHVAFQKVPEGGGVPLAQLCRLATDIFLDSCKHVFSMYSRHKNRSTGWRGDSVYLVVLCCLVQALSELQEQKQKYCQKFLQFFCSQLNTIPNESTRRPKRSLTSFFNSIRCSRMHIDIFAKIQVQRCAFIELLQNDR